jgi:hypothetical protein
MNKAARITRCHVCGDFVQTAAWPWPRCFWSLAINADPARALELSDEFMSDPASTCPAGHWEGFDEPGAVWFYPARRTTCAQCAEYRGLNLFEHDYCVGTGSPVGHDAVFLLGPETNCPLGKWAGLEATPVAVTQEERTARTVIRQVERWTEPLRQTIGQDPNRDAVLESMVAAGLLHPDAALQIAEALDAQ